VANSSLAGGERKARLRERPGRLDSQVPKSIPEPDEAAGQLDPVVAKGLALAAGETVPPTRDRDAHIQQARAELKVLDAAFRVVNGQVEELREVRSVALAERLLGQQREFLRSKRVTRR
jgi:hypothetical protein